MDLHVVNGFLGSGKTTAIISAVQALAAEGQSAAIITNDKGRHLVDTAFAGMHRIPTAEVPGGCFRCNYGDFQARIAALRAGAAPDVIFAESVGSCVDLAGPVLAPLQAAGADGTRVTFSVFADARLLIRALRARPQPFSAALPFSDNVCAIFEQQIAETDLLIINKVDLLAPADRSELHALARRRYPEKEIVLQSSLTPAGVASWLQALAQQQTLPDALAVDYDSYIAGGAELAWFDQTFTLATPTDQGRPIVTQLIDRLLTTLRATGQPIAHLKLFVGDGETAAKLSFTQLDDGDWHAQVPDLQHTPVTLTINARVQMAADALERLVRDALDRTLGDAGVAFTASAATALTPQVLR